MLDGPSPDKETSAKDEAAQAPLAARRTSVRGLENSELEGERSLVTKAGCPSGSVASGARTYEAPAVINSAVHVPLALRCAQPNGGSPKNVLAQTNCGVPVASTVEIAGIESPMKVRATSSSVQSVEADQVR
jgi:hypothetical protein